MRCTAEARCVEGRVGVLLELAKGVHCLVHGAHASMQAYHTPTHLKKELHRSRSRGAQHARDLTPTTLRAPPFISTPSGASAFLRLAYVSAGRPSFHDRYGDSIDVMKVRRTLLGSLLDSGRPLWKEAKKLHINMWWHSSYISSGLFIN